MTIKNIETGSLDKDVIEKEESGASLLDRLLEGANISRGDDNYDSTKEGLRNILEKVAQLQKSSQKKITLNKSLMDEYISDIDKAISKQVDEILHNDKFQALESAWTGLKFVVDKTDFLKNNQLAVLSVSKEELIDDFDDRAENDVLKSGLYHHVYRQEYGVHGGKPYGGMIGNYSFSPSSKDMTLLKNIASIAAMSHAPFIAAVDPKFFGNKEIDFTKMNKFNAGVIHDKLEGQKKWQGFRSSEDARYVGLTLPRFLLRLPYDTEDNTIKSFQYDEATTDDHEQMLWGNTSYAFATRLTDSFAKYGWCPSIIGPKGGGQVDDLHIPNFDALGMAEEKIPTELLIPERLDYELSEEGFIPLVMRKGTGNACFFSANSTQKPKVFQQNDEGFAAAESYTLGTRLPYMYMICRISHYMKLLQREELGGCKNSAELQNELTKWIKQYVSDQENPDSTTRSKKPFRKAQIIVDEIPGKPGHFRVNVRLVPHFKLEGLDVTLSLAGKLD